MRMIWRRSGIDWLKVFYRLCLLRQRDEGLRILNMLQDVEHPYFKIFELITALQVFKRMSDQIDASMSITELHQLNGRHGIDDETINRLDIPQRREVSAADLHDVLYKRSGDDMQEPEVVTICDPVMMDPFSLRLRMK